jgi:hypothetical protein
MRIETLFVVVPFYVIMLLFLFFKFVLGYP